MDVVNAAQVYGKSDRRKIWLLLFFIVGIVAGTVIFNCLAPYEQTRLMIYTDYIAGRIEFDGVNRIELFKYIFVYRLKELMILVIFGLTQYRLVLHSGYICYLGMKYSMLLCMVTVLKGKTAIWYFLMLLTPHVIVYVYLIWYIIRLFDFDNVYRSYRIAGKVLFIFVNLLLMCFLEAFANPLFISIISR